MYVTGPISLPTHQIEHPVVQQYEELEKSELGDGSIKY